MVQISVGSTAQQTACGISELGFDMSRTSLLKYTPSQDGTKPQREEKLDIDGVPRSGARDSLAFAPGLKSPRLSRKPRLRTVAILKHLR
jgi:hypothetical protein